LNFIYFILFFIFILHFFEEVIMTTRTTLFLVLALMVFAPGCVSMVPNPEHQACTRACNEAKNKCMLNATSADAVSKCDGAYQECMQRCAAYPAFIPAEK
jgi:hypothetical protein